ncbi:AAA family ATPase [Pseudomonas aeruginosa]|uniref:AAA family ATPase n=1 Tax=Pseudomonas aeruginosa TaxID=287 RepID=UPI00125D75BA|nr:AAA family ATPase [Pseudomonas aeruginosa]KAB5436800.1 AAA family ATPase [Pseudomonas aeruginosa]MCX4207970.1 AAA family ATPase [Pseudomonas aeruginosa]MCX4226808.1 AAA family ATPase [Pseudomonas aeruginosa]MDK0988879.1 AAA family ATPase [Pseudomonas aeruginosa]
MFKLKGIKKTDRKPLELTELRLRDYRCFEAIDIDFHPQLTVLVAANGAGKTSILDAIAVAFGPYVGAFDEAVGKHFEPSDIRQFQVRRTATNEMEYAPKGVRIEATAFIPDSLIDQLDDDHSPTVWRRSLSSPTKAKTTIKEAKELVNYGKRMQESARTPGSDTLLPLIAYYGTGRLWQQKKLTETKKIQRTSRTVGYTDCLDPASSYKSFVAWFRYWSLNAAEARIKAHEAGHGVIKTEFDDYLLSISRAVNTCIHPSGWSDIEYSFSRDALVAHHEQFGELPVELLSDGIRNMIGLVADIAFRATKLNGHLGCFAAAQTPGLVLIDEVDMHLHPEWQQVVLQSLTQAFPAMQFIVTTHSPQVLSTVSFECVRALRSYIDPDTGKTTTLAKRVEWQTRGVASSDLLARIMGVDPIPNVPEAQWVSDYQALIQQNLHQETEGQVLRKKLEEHFGAQHPVIRECDRMVRLQSFKQRLPRHLGNGED